MALISIIRARACLSAWIGPEILGTLSATQKKSQVRYLIKSSINLLRVLSVLLCVPIWRTSLFRSIKTLLNNIRWFGYFFFYLFFFVFQISLFRHFYSWPCWRQVCQSLWKTCFDCFGKGVKVYTKKKSKKASDKYESRYKSILAATSEDITNTLTIII